MNRIFTIHMNRLLLYNMSIFSTISTPTLLQADRKFVAGGLYESTMESYVAIPPEEVLSPTAILNFPDQGIFSFS